jgi:hypothetical protein
VKILYLFLTVGAVFNVLLMGAAILNNWMHNKRLTVRQRIRGEQLSLRNGMLALGVVSWLWLVAVGIDWWIAK